MLNVNKALTKMLKKTLQKACKSYILKSQSAVKAMKEVDIKAM